ncbi:glycosyltransferase family 2 protein [Rhizobium sp. BE258]|uniref:glycosyltransferase family 2 protein n=1 Tax=Rhizobium sp. BE258 TaxID=2817722 RepID=UPI00285AE966|nr:glycosyltransferase family 2 protein [Rhizobium sp. BE258]MDR7145335.1 succinoglycan biosynthesis protein ExoO [Rhizobium sp. BE258]
MAPDITYVIAAYNAEDSVERAIASALAQTGVNVEVVVCDDCSTDGSASVIARIAQHDERVRYLRMDRNSGPAAARNAAIMHATGRWISILDADDTIEAWRSERLLARDDEAVAAIVDNIVIHSSDGERLLYDIGHLASMPRLELPFFIDHNMVFSGRFNFGYVKPLVRRRFLADHGISYDENLRIGEDYLFMASILASGGVCLVEPVAGYRYTSAAGSVSHVMKSSDVAAMLDGDRRFLARHKLSQQADAAQARRTTNLKRAFAYLRIVDELKAKSLGGALREIAANPAATWLLRMPVVSRLKSSMAAISSLPSAPRHLSK